MTTFNELPIELVCRIIELSIEDFIAKNQRKLERSILIKLCLVSKVFTLHSQSMLRRYVNIVNGQQLTQLIMSGAMKDKKIEKLQISLTLNSSEVKKYQVLKEFLHSLKSVEHLDLTLIAKQETEFDLGELLNTASLRNIKSLCIHSDLALNSLSKTSLPSLQHLTIRGAGCKDVSKIIDSTLNTLVSLNLQQIDFISHLSKRTPLSLRNLAPQLTTLKIDDCNDRIASMLLPLCSSLKTLSLGIKKTMQSSILSPLLSLPNSTRITSLTINIKRSVFYIPVYGRDETPPFASTNTDEEFGILDLLLTSSTFSQLKYLYFATAFSEHDLLEWDENWGFVLGRMRCVTFLEKRGTQVEYV